LFIDHDKNKINSETFINYQIKLNFYDEQPLSCLLFPNNINYNYCLSFQNVFIPVYDQISIHIIHNSLLCNKKELMIDNDKKNNIDNNQIPYFITKFSKNNLSSTLINEESSINYLEIHHSKTLLLYANKLIECIQYQDLPIYLEKNIYTSLVSDNFNIKYCLLEQKWNSHLLNTII